MFLMVPALIMVAGFGDGRASVAPAPVQGSGLMMVNDYPNAALRSGQQGMVWVELSIDAAGKPVFCEIVHSSGFSALDDKSCFILMKRARFAPARDAAGQPIASLYRSRMDWRIDPSAQIDGLPAIVDKTFTVNRLPASVKGQLFVLVRQVVAANGQVESCAVEKGSGQDAIDRLACPAATGLSSTSGIHDANGMIVRGLRLRQVAFTLPPPPVSTWP